LENFRYAFVSRESEQNSSVQFVALT
jgi:hypothetical protein